MEILVLFSEPERRESYDKYHNALDPLLSSNPKCHNSRTDPAKLVASGVRVRLDLLEEFLFVFAVSAGAD